MNITMIKKVTITLVAVMMLFGCKSNTQTPQPSASPSEVTATAGAENSEQTNNEENPDQKGYEVVESSKPLEVPEISSAKDDPERTATIPETPKPDKVITQTISPDDTAGSGVRATEVPDKKVSATSEDNAIILTMQYMKANNIYIPKYIEVEREDSSYYYIHAYEKIQQSGGVENVATVGWYNVNKKTSEVTVGEDDIKVGQRPDTYSE